MSGEAGGSKEKPRSMEEIVLLLERTVSKNPKDGQAWTILSHIIWCRDGLTMRRPPSSTLSISFGESSVLLLEYAEACTSEKLTVTPEAKALFDGPSNWIRESLKANFTLRCMVEQEGKIDRLLLFTRLLQTVRASEEADIARQQVERLSGKKPQAAAAPPEIVAMVEGMAERLNQNGGTPEEWERLIRSYAVLGDREEKRERRWEKRGRL